MNDARAKILVDETKYIKNLVPRISVMIETQLITFFLLQYQCYIIHRLLQKNTAQI